MIETSVRVLYPVVFLLDESISVLFRGLETNEY